MGAVSNPREEGGRETGSSWTSLDCRSLEARADVFRDLGEQSEQESSIQGIAVNCSQASVPRHGAAGTLPSTTQTEPERAKVLDLAAEKHSSKDTEKGERMQGHTSPLRRRRIQGTDKRT